VVWVVYVLISRSGRTYVGLTDDLRRRIAAHNGEGNGGAKSTRAGRPWRVGAVYGPLPTRGAAQRLEYALKRLRGRRRLTVAASRLAVDAVRAGRDSA
jgi:predicted GIY-YIG superfamily endonuclease